MARQLGRYDTQTVASGRYVCAAMDVPWSFESYKIEGVAVRVPGSVNQKADGALDHGLYAIVVPKRACHAGTPRAGSGELAAKR